jgi:hypothetical protein
MDASEPVEAFDFKLRAERLALQLTNRTGSPQPKRPQDAPFCRVDAIFTRVPWSISATIGQAPDTRGMRDDPAT